MHAGGAPSRPPMATAPCWVQRYGGSACKRTHTMPAVRCLAQRCQAVIANAPTPCPRFGAWRRDVGQGLQLPPHQGHGSALATLRSGISPAHGVLPRNTSPPARCLVGCG